jgi:hypothetical protein
VSGGVGRQPDRFADSGEASAAAAGGKGMLEGKLGLFVDEAAGHDKVARHPFSALGFQRFDLMLRGAV